MRTVYSEASMRNFRVEMVVGAVGVLVVVVVVAARCQIAVKGGVPLKPTLVAYEEHTRADGCG